MSHVPPPASSVETASVSANGRLATISAVIGVSGANDSSSITALAPSRPFPTPIDPATLLHYHNKADHVLGCQHYARNCLIRAPCCSDPVAFFACRFCHDDSVSEHKIDRRAISEMVCMKCCISGEARIQSVSNECRDCHEPMAQYYCNICHLFDNTSSHAIFHCLQCGICRRGNPNEYFHCQRCNCCFKTELQSDHRCIENVLGQNCPICLDDLFTSTSPVNFLPCNHAIHQTCLQSLTRSTDMNVAVRCPTCKRSIYPDPERDRTIERYLLLHEMPREYRAWRAEILCNDCLVRSEVAYHFAFHRCPQCRSFNTDVSETIRQAATPLIATDTSANSQSASNGDASPGSQSDSQSVVALPEAYTQAVAQGFDIRQALEAGWQQLAEEQEIDDDEQHDGEDDEDDYEEVVIDFDDDDSIGDESMYRELLIAAAIDSGALPPSSANPQLMDELDEDDDDDENDNDDNHDHHGHDDE